MEGFKPKSKEVLESQLETAESIFGDRLAPEDWSELSLDDIKANHRIRYEKYLEILRESRYPQQTDTVPEEARNLVNALNSLENYLTSHERKELDELRNERQISVFRDLLEFLERGETSGYVKLPTGVGKTVIFLKLVETLGLKSMIVVPSRILITQTGERIEEFTDLEFGAVYSEAKEYDKQVTVITYSSLVSKIEEGLIDPADYPVLILDEAHRSLSDNRITAIDKFHGIKIGFTATPSYSRKKSLSEVLENEIHYMNLSEAIKEGLLCETHTIHAHTQTDLSDVSIMNSENYNEDELEKIVNNKIRNQSAVKLYAQGFSKDKVVCYCSGIAHAHSVQAEFEEEGIPSLVITGETSEAERKIAFERFQKGEVTVLINAKVLIEGFDEPSCNVVFNLHPTLSVVEAEQRGGRALRLQKDNDKKIGYVVDFIDKSTTASENLPVLFSQILGGASILPETSPSSKRRKKEEEEDVVEDEAGDAVIEDEDKESELKKLMIEGLEINVDAESILQVTNEHMGSKQLQEFPTQKEGWLSIDELLQIYPKSKSSLRTFIATYYDDAIFTQPEVQLSVTTNKPVLFYPPEFVEFLQKKVEEVSTNEYKKEWKSMGTLSAELKASPETISKVIKHLNFIDGIDTKRLFLNLHRSHKYYSPEAVSLISAEIKKMEYALKMIADEKNKQKLSIKLQKEKERSERALLDELIKKYESKILFEIGNEELVSQIKELIREERRTNQGTFNIVDGNLVVTKEFESSLKKLIDSFRQPAPSNSSAWGTYTPTTTTKKPKRY